MVNFSLIKSKYLIEWLSYVDERENKREPRFLQTCATHSKRHYGNQSRRKEGESGRKENVI